MSISCLSGTGNCGFKPRDHDMFVAGCAKRRTACCKNAATVRPITRFTNVSPYTLEADHHQKASEAFPSVVLQNIVLRCTVCTARCAHYRKQLQNSTHVHWGYRHGLVFWVVNLERLHYSEAPQGVGTLTTLLLLCIWHQGGTHRRKRGTPPPALTAGLAQNHV